MSKFCSEGVLIACLVSSNGKVAGRVYLWDTADLGILWLGSDREVAFINPPIADKVFEAASALDSSEVVKFLKELTSKSTRIT